MTEDFFSNEEFRQKLEVEYLKFKSLYEKLVDEVLYILGEELEKQEIKFHSLTHRKDKIKSFESFYAKVKRKQYREKQFELIEDIAGVRIICLYRHDLERIGNLIQKCFIVNKVDTSRTRTEVTFGYSSDHYVVKISENCKGARYDNIRELPCEIQVRTILMDAWASVSHHLDYKQELDIPFETRNDFNALSGLFYVADTHFELFERGINEARAKMQRKAEKGQFDYNQAINLDNLIAFLKLKFPTRQGSNAEDYSLLNKELGDFGYKNFVKLDEKINKASKVFSEFETELDQYFVNENPSLYKSGDFCPTDVGMVRYSLNLTDTSYWKGRPHHNKGVIDIVEKYRKLLLENV
jgi:ppGpp synthetase/RelA/SpoT-type nucleotidyltranferase